MFFVAPRNNARWYSRFAAYSNKHFCKKSFCFEVEKSAPLFFHVECVGLLNRVMLNPILARDVGRELLNRDRLSWI